MTYGENAAVIREELTALLAQHRIQQRLGGPGTYSVPASTTLEERAEMGRIIQRYRAAALTWCRQAIAAVNPKIDAHRRPRKDRTPEQELRVQLDRVAPADFSGPRLLELLSIEHDFELLARWQRVARAAALGEHDFTAGVNLGHLTIEQSRVVALDAAAAVRGLVILDRRYDNIPDWKHLPGAAALDRAAESIIQLLDQEPRDFSVDSHGWRPAPALITGPVAPGVAGAVQAQHNLLVHLTGFPNALNLRRLLHAQAQISHHAAHLATRTTPDLVACFTERAEVYRTLLAQSRNIGGVAGGGGPAVAASQNALTRLRHAAPEEPDHAASLHEVRRLFSCTDARLLATIERGFHEKLYFVPAKVPRITNQQINGIFQPRQRWMPVSSIADTELLPTARQRLRPTSVPRSGTITTRAKHEGCGASVDRRLEPPTAPAVRAR